MSRDTPNHNINTSFYFKPTKSSGRSWRLGVERTHLAQGSSGAHGLFKHFNSRHELKSARERWLLQKHSVLLLREQQCG